MFKRHFRIYLVNNHPAYIVGEDKDEYIFHRVTSSKSSGGRNNFVIIPNPLYSGRNVMYIVKRKQKDKKNRFSKFILKMVPGNKADFSFIDKKTPSTSANSDATLSGSKNIKTNKKMIVKKKIY